MLTPEREEIQGTQCSAEKDRCTSGKFPLWFFVCTVRGLDRMGSGDYGKGSRAWFSEPDSPGCGRCCFYRVSCAALYPHSPLWVPLLGCKLG